MQLRVYVLLIKVHTAISIGTLDNSHSKQWEVQVQVQLHPQVQQ